MPQIEDIQEEVLTELFGTTNIASSLWGLFGGEGTGYINRTKKNVASTLKKAETFVEKRRAVYAGKSYASIRETVDETMQRLLKEMDLEEWKVTPRLRDDPEYAYQMALRAGRIAGKAYDRGSVDKRLATGNAEGFVGAVHDAHQKRIADTKTADKILGGAAPGAFDADIIRNDIQTNFDQELDQAAVSSSWMSNFDNMRRRADGNKYNAPDIQNSVVREGVNAIVDGILNEYWTLNPTKHDFVKHDTYLSALNDAAKEQGWLQNKGK